MGSDRNRSNTPLWMSELIAMPVYMVMNDTFITTIAGSSTCR